MLLHRNAQCTGRQHFAHQDKQSEMCMCAGMARSTRRTAAPCASATRSSCTMCRRMARAAPPSRSSAAPPGDQCKMALPEVVCIDVLKRIIFCCRRNHRLIRRVSSALSSVGCEISCVAAHSNESCHACSATSSSQTNSPGDCGTLSSNQAASTTSGRSSRKTQLDAHCCRHVGPPPAASPAASLPATRRRQGLAAQCAPPAAAPCRSVPPPSPATTPSRSEPPGCFNYCCPVIESIQSQILEPMR